MILYLPQSARSSFHIPAKVHQDCSGHKIVFSDRNFYQHFVWSIEGSKFLSESAFKNSVLKRKDKLMIFFKTMQKFFVQTGSETRIYQGRGKSTFFLDCRGNSFSFLKEISQRNNGNLFAFLLNLKAVQIIIVFICRAVTNIINLRIKNCFFDLQSTYLLS